MREKDRERGGRGNKAKYCIAGRRIYSYPELINSSIFIAIPLTTSKPVLIGLRLLPLKDVQAELT